MSVDRKRGLEEGQGRRQGEQQSNNFVMLSVFYEKDIGKENRGGKASSSDEIERKRLHSETTYDSNHLQNDEASKDVHEKKGFRCFNWTKEESPNSLANEATSDPAAGTVHHHPKRYIANWVKPAWSSWQKSAIHSVVIRCNKYRRRPFQIYRQIQLGGIKGRLQRYIILEAFIVQQTVRLQKKFHMWREWRRRNILRQSFVDSEQ